MPFQHFAAIIPLGHLLASSIDKSADDRAEHNDPEDDELHPVVELRRRTGRKRQQRCRDEQGHAEPDPNRGSPGCSGRPIDSRMPVSAWIFFMR